MQKEKLNKGKWIVFLIFNGKLFCFNIGIHFSEWTETWMFLQNIKLTPNVRHSLASNNPPSPFLFVPFFRVTENLNKTTKPFSGGAEAKEKKWRPKCGTMKLKDYFFQMNYTLVQKEKVLFLLSYIIMFQMSSSPGPVLN